MHFKVRPGTAFKKVGPWRARAIARPAGERALRPFPPLQIFDAYCSKKSLQKGQVRFLFDGRRIQDTETPAEVRGQRAGRLLA